MGRKLNRKKYRTEKKEEEELTQWPLQCSGRGAHHRQRRAQFDAAPEAGRRRLRFGHDTGIVLVQQGTAGRHGAAHP